jgi:hypothetical protein
MLPVMNLVGYEVQSLPIQVFGINRVVNAILLDGI